MDVSYWATHSTVSRPDDDALAAIDQLSRNISSLHHAASQLVLHYRACASEVLPSRRDEIHTLYADIMLSRVLSRGATPSLSRERAPIDRTVGCCRDSTVLFLSLARQKDIPARARVGFAAYFCDGWMLDHVVAEVWDIQEKRWRLVDPDMPANLVRIVGSHTVDWLDLRPGVDFQTGPEAWAAAREGKVDPDRYVVAPEIGDAKLRGMPYIAHNVVHDLASMNKQEMLVHDGWGLLLGLVNGCVSQADTVVLDEISRLLLDRGVESSVVSSLMARDILRIPEVIMRFDPNAPSELLNMIQHHVQRPACAFHK